MKKPIIVAGCGRSGTHWLGDVMQAVLGKGAAGHEPGGQHADGFMAASEVAVDSRLRHRIDGLHADGHPIVHLVRDGRDVVRSLHTWYARGAIGERHAFWECCDEWNKAIDMMQGHRIVRLEDLIKPRGVSKNPHLMPRWRQWDAARTREFWELCGDRMRSVGYDEKGPVEDEVKA
jgi:hypothetical protein